MSATIRTNVATSDTWTTIHPLTPEDSAAMTALRNMVAGMKGKFEGVAARGPFNAIIEHVAAPHGVTFEADTVGGISGWCARAANGKKGAAVLHLHGGWFNWGTAQAFRNVVGHIASSAGASNIVTWPVDDEITFRQAQVDAIPLRQAASPALISRIVKFRLKQNLSKKK